MADRYWVGGTGTWNTSSTTNWSTASNGASGASAPTSADDVFIDTSSGTGTITCTGGVCNNITVTATQAIILGAASSTLSVFGDLTFPSGGSFSANTNTNTITFAGTTTGLTITTNGKTLSALIFNGVGGGWQLQDNLTSTGNITLTNGALDLNDKTLSCFLFSSNNSNTRSIAFGTSGQINLTGNSTTLWGFPTLTNFSFTGTSKVNLTANATTGTRGIQHGQTAGGSESLAFNFNITAGSDTTTIFSFIRNLDYTGFSGTMGNDNVANKAIYGNLTLSSTMSLASGNAALSFRSTTQQQNITSAGKTMDFPVTINGTQTVQLQDALTLGSTRTLTLTAGTLDANIYNVTTGVFNYNNTNTKSILMGSGTWTMTSSATVWSANTTGTTLTRNTSTINLSSASAKTFSGAGLTYYNVVNTGAGTATITGSNTYNNLSALGGCPLTITSGTTQSANTFTFQGASSTTIAPSSTTNYTFTKLGGGIVDMQNVSISRCTASPSTGTWYAGASTDGGNNTGIRFVSAPKFMVVF